MVVDEGFDFRYQPRTVCGLWIVRGSVSSRNTPVDTKYPQSVFAIRLKDDEMLYRSASGGAFAGM